MVACPRPAAGRCGALARVLRQLGLEELIVPVPSRRRDLVTAMAVAQVAKVKDRFGIGRVVLVGDRDMLTAAWLREDVAPRAWTGSPRCAPRRSRR